MSLPFVWAALARHGSPLRGPGASKPRDYFHLETTFLIISFMACRISTIPSALACTSSGGLRAATRSKSQCFLPFSSRALHGWARNNTTGQRPALLIPLSKRPSLLQRSSVFSTSSRLNDERKAGKEATSQGFSEQKAEVGHSF